MAAPGDGQEKKKAGKNKHGFPRGFRFVPEDQELLEILDNKLRGAPLDRAHDAVFHDTQILDFHPAKLYGMYAEDEENGYIYFFSTIEFKAAKPKQKKWPRRAAQGGRWKVVLGSSQTVEVGGVAVGRKLTMEFFVKGLRRNWGMHEFVRIIRPKDEVSDLAVYRLYKTNGEDKPGDLAADGTKSTNQRGQALATDYYQYATSQAYTYASPYLQPGGSQRYPYDIVAAAPPTAPWPIWWAPLTAPGPVWWAPPTTPGHVWWAPPTAPGSYDCYYASTDSRPPPPVAASTLGQKGKGKAPMTSTENAGSTNTSAATPAANNQPPPPPVAATASTLGKKGKGKCEAPTTSTDHAGSTNTSAPPAANYHPPPPSPTLQRTEHILASGVVVGHEDEEGYLVVDELNARCNTQQGSSSVAAAPAVLEMTTTTTAVPPVQVRVACS